MLVFVNPATSPNTLADEDREYLRVLVQKDGLHATAKNLGLSRGVISSAIGGISVRRGSIEMVRDALAQHREAAK